MRFGLGAIAAASILAGCTPATRPAERICPASTLVYGEEAELSFTLMTDGAGINVAALTLCPDVQMHPYLTNVPPNERNAFWDEIRETIASHVPNGMGTFRVVARGFIEPETKDYGVPKIVISTVVSVQPVDVSPADSAPIS